jgi:predicted ATPase
MIENVADSVTGLLTSKVDKLTPSQQIILKVASIIGRTFPVRLLTSCLPVETDT